MVAEFEVYTALDGPRIDQSNREFQSCYKITIKESAPYFTIFPLFQVKSHFEGKKLRNCLSSVSYQAAATTVILYSHWLMNVLRDVL